MKRFFLFLKFLIRVKFKFKSPDKQKIIVFDNQTIDDLKNILENYDYFLLKSRIEKIDCIYFSPNILKNFIKNFEGNIMTAYFVALIKEINPKIVLTHIDNSFKFFDITKKLHKEFCVIAIQNAYRIDIGEYKHRYEKKLTESDYRKKFYIPNFFCFGKFEIDLYKKHKLNVKKFFIVGSLRLANFFYYLKKNKINLKKKYDICLISESFVGREDIFGIPDFEKRAALLVKFTLKFCMKHKMKLVYPLKYGKQKFNISYFKKYLNKDEYKYLIKNSADRKNTFSSYTAMNQSKVTVAVISTLLSEHLSTGEKILACNLTPTKLWDFPIDGVCFIKNCTYEQFEKRLFNIYSMPKRKYLLKINKGKNYLVDYNKKNSTIKKIKSKLDYFLDL